MRDLTVLPAKNWQVVGGWFVFTVRQQLFVSFFGMRVSGESGGGGGGGGVEIFPLEFSVL